MAGNSWRTGTGVGAYFRRHYQEFEFAQAVQLLCAARSNRVTSLEVIDDSLRFGSHNGDEFPASEIIAIQKAGPQQVKIIVSFFGLLGQHGPLPQPYQHWVRDNAAKNDRALEDFLNIFNHRLIALLYMILARHRPALQAQHPQFSDQSRYLDALMGTKILDGKQRRNSLPISSRGLQHCAGLLANRRISMPRVQNILQMHLRENVYIDPFTGGWLPLAQEQCTLLSARDGDTGAAKRLGRDSVLGSKVWDQSAGITLYIGPLGWRKFKSLLPGEEKHRQLRVLILYLTEQRWRVRVYLLLKQQEVPRSVLEAMGEYPTQLGRSSWLHSGHTFYTSVKDKVLSRLPKKIQKRFEGEFVFTQLQFAPAHFSTAEAA